MLFMRRFHSLRCQFKTPAGFSGDIVKLILKLIWKYKLSGIAKTSLKKNNAEKKFKTNYKNTRIKVPSRKYQER